MRSIVSSRNLSPLGLLVYHQGALENTASKTRSGSSGVLHLPQCKLLVTRGPQRGREYVFSSDVIRAGKASDNDVVLADETVSRGHFEILRDAKGYLLRDLQSTNGTILDGAEIREGYIRSGSLITAGTVQLKFLIADERIPVRPSKQSELGELYGESLAMREIFGLLERVAPLDVTLLIEGEAGSGKELLARTAHAFSQRREGPFLAVDCGALDGHLLESALFGHEKGAFPGAHTTRQGALELASGGTILLHHVDELGLDFQPRLLRVLEQREIRRVGGNRTIKVDLRVMASSLRDLRTEVERGKFREDLFFRLAFVPLRLPPLRDRAEDVPGLVARFRRAAPKAPLLDDGAVVALQTHDWPGNVRELKEFVERGFTLGGGAADESVDESIHEALKFDEKASYRDTKDRWDGEFERRYLKWLIARTAGNISRAAREADMDRKYLHKLLKKHKIVV